MTSVMRGINPVTMTFSDKRGINPVKMTINNPWKKISLEIQTSDPLVFNSAATDSVTDYWSLIPIKVRQQRGSGLTLE